MMMFVYNRIGKFFGNAYDPESQTGGQIQSSETPFLTYFVIAKLCQIVKWQLL
jgi:hypothetical protein